MCTLKCYTFLDVIIRGHWIFYTRPSLETLKSCWLATKLNSKQKHFKLWEIALLKSLTITIFPPVPAIITWGLLSLTRDILLTTLNIPTYILHRLHTLDEKKSPILYTLLSYYIKSPPCANIVSTKKPVTKLWMFAPPHKFAKEKKIT